MGKVEERFGRNIRIYRASRLWTQADLADCMGRFGTRLHPSAIAKMETATRAIRLSEAASIAAAFGVTVDDLLLERVTP